MIININKSLIYDLEKSWDDSKKAISRTEAKKAHGDLPPGGEWRTIRGHHVYIKNGKVLAGAFGGIKTIKKATKKHLALYQEHIDKESKGAKKDGPSKKSTKTNAGAGRGSKTQSSPVKPAPASKPKPTKKPSGTKSDKPTSKTKQVKPKTAPPKKEAPKKAEPKKKAPAKTPSKPKDIRTAKQVNRDTAYDVGEKIGGARKEDYENAFKFSPTIQNLKALAKESPETAIKLAVKKNIIKPMDWEAEYQRGVDVQTAVLKDLIYGRIAPKPLSEDPKDIEGYIAGIDKLKRHLEPIKDFKTFREALSELRNIARKGYRLASAKHALANKERYSYINEDAYNKDVEEGEKAKKIMDFSMLGDKLENFFTNWDSFDRTLQTVRKKAKSWDDIFEQAGAKFQEKKPKKDIKKMWERATVSEHMRKGGRETKVKKPEDMIKNFGMKGIEFGNWVDDASGMYHLKRSAEAFHDLADLIGIEDKDISLNGRLSMAFGARGSGGAVAHYEPTKKVINMTKFGGAGSLAHEWGHAMDNILYQYSQGGKPSLAYASEGPGDHDPAIEDHYADLMSAIIFPQPGEKGGVKTVNLDSSEKPPAKYYPEMRRDVADGMEPHEVWKKWSAKLTERVDRQISNVMSSPWRNPQEKEKEIKKLKSQKKRELNALPHYLAQELRYKQNGGKYGGDHYKGTLEIPTGESQYYRKMQELDGARDPYFSSRREMFARAFETYVEDKINAKGRMNNYLVWDTKTKHPDNPFPQGKERKAIVDAMDRLVNYVAKSKVLKKALRMIDGPKLVIDLRKSINNYDDRLRSLKERRTEPYVDKEMARKFSEPELRSYSLNKARNAYNVPNPEAVIYIPINRLKTPYQTEQATDWDKVGENVAKMERGEHLEPIVIGYDYDIHDGHHRYEGSKIMDYTHVPCVVGGSDPLEKQRAEESYREVWKSIVPDYSDTPSAFQDNGSWVFRGIGQKELDYIKRTGFIQSKGKGNDDDVDKKTCFSNLYQQALAYAKTNYSEYNEPQAYVIAVPTPWYVMEDEKGEMVSDRPVPATEMAVIPVPKDEHEKHDFR